MANYRLCRITMKHGNKRDIPELLLGEPAFCKDTGELYIGNGEGLPPTRVGSISEEQLKALEQQINEALEYAKKTSSTLETDLVANGVKVGSVSINNQGVNVKDVNNIVKFSIDTSFITYAETLKVGNISLSNLANTGIMPVTRGFKNQLLTFYVSSSPKGKGDGTSRENACSDFYTVADTLFKTYGHLCPATKLQIWIDPGVYTQDMSIPHFPGNIWEIYIQTDVNGTTLFNKTVNVYYSNCSIHFSGNSLGIFKFSSIETSSTAETGANAVNSAVAVFGSNVNLGFSYCHWVTAITSGYSKYCIYVTQGSRQVNFSFDYCDFYGYDALVYKGESHGEIVMRHSCGNLTDWTDKTLKSLGFRIYITGSYPVFTNANDIVIIHNYGSPTATNSSYYKTTIDPGGSGTVVEPPTVTETWISKKERYAIGTPGTRVYNWSASFSYEYDPDKYPNQAIPNKYGESSLEEYLSQGSYPVAGYVSKVASYNVDYGTWAFDEEIMIHFQELSKKELTGTITNLTAKFIFTHYSYNSETVYPRIIYPVAGIDIPNHMVRDNGYYVTQPYGMTSDGKPMYVLDLDSNHQLAAPIKNDIFDYDTLIKANSIYDRYGSVARYGIQLGSYLAKDKGWFGVELIVSYKEKTSIVG